MKSWRWRDRVREGMRGFKSVGIERSDEGKEKRVILSL